MQYSQTVSRRFHVHRATLDVEKAKPLTDNQRVSVWLVHNGNNHLLCNLSKNKWHSYLYLTFALRDEITFYSKGGTVQLTGFYLDAPDAPRTVALDVVAPGHSAHGAFAPVEATDPSEVEYEDDEQDGENTEEGETDDEKGGNGEENKGEYNEM